MDRTWFWRALEALRAWPRYGALTSFCNIARLLGNFGSVGLSVCDHPQGLLPTAGHRLDHRYVRSRTGYFLRCNATVSGSTWQHRRERPRGCACGDVHWRLRKCAQYRADVRNIEAA